MDSLETDRLWARNLGAGVVVTGVFARKGDRVGILLWATDASGLPRLIGQVYSSGPLSDQRTSPRPESASPLDRAGSNGSTIPECIYCPAPTYSPEASATNLQGSVVLQLTVNGTVAPPTS